MFDIEPFISSGLVPIPISMPDKSPANGFSQGAWYASKPSPEEIRQAWQKYGQNANGIALICGHGLELLDIDLQADPDGSIDSRFYNALQEDAPQLLAKLVIEKSISGGTHYWYRMPEGLEYPNTKLARLEYSDDDRFVLGPKYYNVKSGAIIETRGRGGYGICFPTPGYEMIDGAFSGIQTLTPDEHDLLWQIAISFNQYVETPTFIPNESTGPANKPGDDYNARTSAQDMAMLLAAEGWTVNATRGDYVYLRRPGKDRGTSGVIVQSKKLFVSYSTSVSEFEPGKGYSPWRCYAIIKHGGDFRAAAKALSGIGYGEQQQQSVVNIIVPPADLPTEVLAKYDQFRVSLMARPNIDFNLFMVDRPSKRPHAVPEMYGLAFPGALITVVGKAKSRKTTVLTSLVASALPYDKVGSFEVCGFVYNTPGKILWIDTEQPEFYAWITHWRICVQAGGLNDRLYFYSMYKRTREEIKADIVALLHAIKPAVVVIDGVADLIRSVNKEEDSLEFVTQWLRPLTFPYNSTVFTVLHLNKSDGQLSGWIGTILSKKSDGVLQVDQVDDMSVDVHVREARAERPPAFRLYTERGMHGILFKDEKPAYNYTLGFENEHAMQIAAESQHVDEVEEVAIEDDDIPF